VDVKKIQINNGTLSGVTELLIKIPISTSFSPVDQSDIIERKFVETGIRGSINKIVDYERVRFSPYDNSGNKMKFVRYKLHFIAGNTYGDIDFVNDDLRFRRNNLKESFLRLSFYNNDKPTIGDKLFDVTIHPQFLVTTPGGDFESENIQFNLSDPITNPSGFAEGLFLYNNKDDEMYTTTGTSIYMKAEFNNAKTGFSHKMMTSSTPVLNANEVIDVIYTKYILKRENNKYIYYLDTTYNQNIVYSSNEVLINLYETEII